MATAFSYAEAAKGLAPPAAPAQVEKPSKQSSAENAGDAVTLPEKEKQLESPAQSSEPQVTPTHQHVATPDVNGGLKQEGKEVSSGATELPASPAFGADSTATLLKDDDTTGNLHDGSESTTWEKVSQDSRAADKISKADLDSNDSKSTNWEHVPVPLKDAPPPAVNPWLKRAQEMQAKVASVPSVTSVQVGSDASGSYGKKRNQRASVAESGAQRPDKLGGLKGQDEEVPVRRYRPASETKAMARMPPPASDATSWPTPEVAASTEERKRSVSDRTEPAEQERSTSGKHGKTEWVSIPFVPTPVFNTPLPSGRRGGRAGGRGGREGAPSRGPPSGSAVEPSDRSPSTQRGDASVDGSKSDTAGQRQNTGQRQKRMSNAGQSRREFRKGDDAREERPPRSFDQESNTTTGDTPRFSRRPFQGNDQGEFSRRQPISPGGPKGTIPNGAGLDASSVQGEHAGGSRPTEKRGEFGYHGPRENGNPREGRTDRGGRGFRGRGGHASSMGHQANYTNGVNYGFGPGFNPNKNSHDQRQTSQSGYGANREGRHTRANSRTQPSPAGQFPPRYGVGPNMPMSFPPMAPEMAAGYGFVPGMAPPFYHPYQDQQGLVGMIMEQMRYWFSFENLIRDLYLRKRMDDNGFVPLSFLMPWKRMQVLTSDVKMVRFACQNVPQIELRVDKDGNEHVRKAHEWEKWVFPLDERHEDAQKAGSPQLFPVFQADPSHQQQNYPPQQRHHPKVPPMRMTNGSPSRSSHAGGDDMPNGNSSAASGSQTPLSATVPEFKPEGRLASFPDPQIDSLTVVSQTIPTD